MRFCLFVFRREHLRTGPSRFKTDGLNSVKYHIKEIKLEIAYTRIFVNFVPEEVIHRASLKEMFNHEFMRVEVFRFFSLRLATPDSFVDINFCLLHFQFQQLGGDSKFLNESNKPGYDPKTPPTTPEPLDSDFDDKDVDFHGKIVLSKIAESQSFNDSAKFSLKKSLINIFKKLG